MTPQKFRASRSDPPKNLGITLRCSKVLGLTVRSLKNSLALRNDFTGCERLGSKQTIRTNLQHKQHLEFAPTRQPEMFKIFQENVGSAWQLQKTMMQSLLGGAWGLSNRLI